jgi:hypothetical protein
LLPNDLIIVRNYGDDEDERDIKRALEIQSNSEFQSLISSTTQSLGSPRLQINVHDAFQIEFGRSTYARKEHKITFPIAPVLGPTKFGLEQNF